MPAIRNFEICQQVEYMKDKSIESIKKVIESHDAIGKYAYILHDRDVDDKGNSNAAHYHIMVGLKSPRQWSTIVNMFGGEIPEQYFCKIKSTWADALAYLTHANAPEKYQYDANEVVANFDWEGESKDSSSRLKEVIGKITSGEIRRFNYTEHIDAQVYIKHKRQIEAAFEYRADSMRGVDRNMECIYITGDSGTGKTTYAKEFAKRQKYSIFISSGSNDVLDGYTGEDCIILDDLRPSCLGLSDLLKMLDNNTSSTVRSRYKNKVLECKVIIITTTLDIESFFRNVFTEEPETIIQLKRRCKTMIEFPKGKSDKIYIREYESDTRDYGTPTEIANPVPKLIEKEKVEEKARLDRFKF